jgi:hypothetical protein
MRCLIFLSTVALSGCGHVGAAIARTIPDEYRWIGFVIAALALAMQSYVLWGQESRLSGVHWLLIPALGISILLVWFEIERQGNFAA